MKQFKKSFVTLTLVFVMLMQITGCQKKDPSVHCPFTTITWENNLEDIEAEEGKSTDTYDSIYEGTTYTYPKTYLEKEGIVKYMFDDKDKLVSMSWFYQPSDSDELTKLYDTIHKELVKEYGKSGFEYESEKFENMTSPGDVWYRKDGNIILNTVNTNDMRIVQFTFVHPSVSDKK